MSETEKTEIKMPFMSETEIAALSVSALSNRPNEHSGQYGRKGLTPEELKAAFSALPVAIAEKMNELLPQIIERFSETEEAFGEADEALKSEITEAIEGLRAGKLDKLERPYPVPDTYIYGEDKDGNTVLVRSSVSTAPNALVARDENGDFFVGKPTKATHPVNKLYFAQKSNNSLYSEVTDMERRMKSLEHAASGNIYETVTLSGNASAAQVDNACPYGILSRLGGNVTKIKVGLPFNTFGAAAHYGNPVTENVTPNSVSIPIGETANVRIPCNITAPCTATVWVDESSDMDSLYKSGFSDENAKPIIQGRFTGELPVTFSLEEGNPSARYIVFLKTLQGTALSDAIYINGIRLMISEPEKAEILYDLEEIEIPEEIRALNGYGETGAYIDFAERRFYNASGAATDISGYLSDEADIISLLPSAIVRFYDASGNAVAAEYSLSYKNKITG